MNITSPTPRDILRNPQTYHQSPAVLQSSWAELKAQRGHPITDDRMERLCPAYGILPARTALHLPAAEQDEPINSDTRLAHQENFVRNAVIAAGHTARSAITFGGGAA